MSRLQHDMLDCWLDDDERQGDEDLEEECLLQVHRGVSIVVSARRVLRQAALAKLAPSHTSMTLLINRSA